ncbi:MAG: CPXCG motif-containing cysteine-rich protein [Xanthomonadales bacterium]|jgi:transcription elongation factor Elf1
MEALFETSLECPYCGETVSVLVERSPGSQAYYEDCSVCCKPMAIVVSVDDDGSAQVSARSEDDA